MLYMYVCLDIQLLSQLCMMIDSQRCRRPLKNNKIKYCLQIILYFVNKKKNNTVPGTIPYLLADDDDEKEKLCFENLSNPNTTAKLVWVIFAFPPN